MARKTAAKTARTIAPADNAGVDRSLADKRLTDTSGTDEASSGRRTTIVAHLATGEDIKSALISSDDDLDVEFEGDDPRDQHATVTTDAGGVLTWALVLETAFAHASWQLTLTKRGAAEGAPDAEGTTDAQGRAVPSDIKAF